MQEFFSNYISYVQKFAGAIFDPEQRVYLLYIGTSLFAALVVFRVGLKQKDQGLRGFISFVFPRSVWSHSSAWLDVRYFFFHKLIGHFLLFGLAAAAATFTFEGVAGTSIGSVPATAQGGLSWGIVLGYMVVTALVADFIGYFVHYLQHKLPILWEFHKVHHSAEVMHPLSNYREHPVDNLFYLLCIGAGFGATAGAAYRLLGVVPDVPSILGIPVLMFLFNIAAYNLRHSHIWLRWPGVWSKVFPSPAHHHVHHSCHPDHFDKNFAFMFPFWDVIFGTYTMPADNRDVKFGVAGMKSMEMDSCWKLYAMPFVKVGRRVKRRWRKRHSS